jgi:Flp pilus assembly CpaF family ATPase
VADFDDANLRAIDRLNQRGGRMLSLVDLVAAGTLTVDAAALLAATVAGGGSILTAAGPGGVGKTTLLGGCLACLPRTTEIVTVDKASVLEQPAPRHARCLLVHEVNDAAYYAYLWGPEIGRMVSMIGPGCAIAGTLHAETCDGVLRKLQGPPLRARREDLARVDLIVLMAADGGRRLVTELGRADGRGGHERLAPDAGSGPAPWRALLADALARNVRSIELVRGMALRAGLV